MSPSARKTILRCVACRNAIRGKPRVMTLQITTEEPRFLTKAKSLGFTSTSWRTGGSMKGNFHRNCFELAALVWQVAFETRAVSPRR